MSKNKFQLWNRISVATLLFVFGLFLLLTGVFSFTRGHNARVEAATSTSLNMQARLYSSAGNIVPDGYYNVEFTLYDALSGGSELWDETWYDSNGASAGQDNRVRVVNGYMSVPLGSLDAFPALNWDQDMWVTINVGGTTQTATPTWDGEMSPRIKLTSVPFAQAARNVYSSHTNSASTNSGNVSISTGNATGSTSNSGNISIDVGTATQTAGTISIGTANASGITIGRTGVATSIAGNLTVNGSQFTNNGSTLNNAQSLGNFPTGGAIGTAAATVDVDTAFSIAQTTVGQTLSLPNPTSATAGRVVYVLNTGSATFTMHGVSIPAGYGQIYVWNGSTWILGASGGGAAITLQSAYDGGNTLTTADAKDIDITLANTATDANFTIDIATGSTSEFQIESNGTDILQIGSGGQLQLDVQGSGGGILLGGDALLYRSAADTLRTSDALTVDQLFTGSLGANISGGTINLNASSNNATNINTGSSTGAVSIGGGSGTVAIDSTNWDVSTGGAISGLTGYSQASGNFGISGAGTFSTGTGAISLNGATSVTGSNTFTTGTGTVTLQGNTNVSNTVSLATQAGSTYTTAGSANNVAISTASYYLLDTSGAAQTITGIVAGRDGQLLTLVNIDASNNVTLSNNSGSSSAANRITTGTGGDMTITPGNGVQLIYDATSSLWRVVGTTATSGGYANTALSNLSATSINQALNPNADNTLDLGSSSNSWRTLYADTSVLTPSVDVASAGALSLGNSTATSVSICNSAACDTITIGTNTDADTISVGDANDTINITGTNISFTGSTGQLALSATGSSGGLVIGGDTNLYRASANELKTDDNLTVGPAGYNSLGTLTTYNATSNRFTMDTATLTAGILNNGTDYYAAADGTGDFIWRSGVTWNGDWTATGSEIARFTDAGQFRLPTTGSGAGILLGGDAQIYRSAANTLSLGSGDSLSVTNTNSEYIDLVGTDTNATYLRVGNNATSDWILASDVIGDADVRFDITADGTMSWGNGTNPQDTNLYRNGASRLATDDTFVLSGGNVEVNGGMVTVGGTSTSDVTYEAFVSGDATNRFNIQANGQFNWGDGTNPQDTNLYRSAAGELTSDGNLQLGQGANRTFKVQTRSTNAVGNNLTISAGNAGSGGSAFAGGTLSLQGGSAAGTGNANGGGIILAGGAGTGTGVKGLVVVESSAFSASTVQNFTGSANITQANVDNFSTLLISSNAAGYTATLTDPTITTAGRLAYVTNTGLYDMTLSVNGGGTGNTLTLKPNATATMIWNGVDWTAAGASSSTDLQAAYNNTATSAGGAELVLNAPGGSADGLTIRNNATTPISGGILEVQSSIGTNLFSVNSLGTELAANGGSETAGTWGTNWTTVGAATVARTTTSGEYLTGLGAAEINTTAAANDGIRNNLSGNPVVSTTYQVSFSAKLNSGTFTDLQVYYSRDGGTDLEACTNYSTQTLSTSAWTKITCTITTDSTSPTNPDLIIRQGGATARNFWVENLSFIRNDSTTEPSHVQIGGGISGGQVTLFTLDRSSAPPVANGNTTYLGSMYYDTTSGRIQCYEADGWGACGSAPDNFVNLVPEYPGAVLNGTGVGVMSADFCANQSGVLQVNSSFCSTGQALNYYSWTSPQPTQQDYSIYVTYQLPAAFKNFSSNSTVSLTARTDNTTNGQVTYQMFRSQGGTLYACGTETTVTSSNNTWQTVGINGNEYDGCGFDSTSANSNVIFKINVKAHSNANVYVGTLSFTTVGQ